MPPLVNLKGEVVGINTAIKTNGGGYEGVGFAVPASRARRVAADLVEFGRVRRAYLGVTIRPVDPATADRLGSAAAALITGIAVASPAAEAGLQAGDVILKVDGKPVDGPGPLQAIIEVAAVGKPLALTIDRNGQVSERSVVPEPQPDRLALPAANGQGGININVPGANIVVPGPNLNIGAPRRRGARGSSAAGNAVPPPSPTGPPGRAPPATGACPALRSSVALPPPRERLRPHARAAGDRRPDAHEVPGTPASGFPNRRRPSSVNSRLDREPRGLFVTGVEPDGPADRGGLEIGMVITDAAGRKVANLVEFRESLANRPANRDLLVRILKGAKAEFRVIVDRSGPSDSGPLDLPPPVDPPRLEPLPGGDPKESPARVEKPEPSTPKQRPD